MTPEILQLLPVAIFSLGAPAFVLLSIFYWRHQRRGTATFRIFTAVCAGAFVMNLVALFSAIDNAVFETVRALLASVLPPLMLHLTLERAGRAVPRRSLWLGGLRVLYALSFVSAVTPRLVSGDGWDALSSWLLMFCAALSLGALFFSDQGRAERIWMVGLFGAMFVCAGATLFRGDPLFEIVPDYLLLLFFSVHLYYSERLAFFDVFLRLGAFAGVGMLALTGAMAAVPNFRGALGGDWNHLWVAALALLPIWLLAPFLYRRLGAWVDRKALGRRYSVAEAQIAFVLKLQEAATEEQLQGQAVEALETIFNCRAQIDLGRATPGEPGDLAALVRPEGGSILLKSRANQSPFLSDEGHLLHSLAGILGVMLQNVRLRTLANRAELRALRAQVNPHFLFNALNAVASFIGSKPEEAEETLTQLADVFRYTLNRAHKEWVALSEEIEFLRAYLAVEQARFAARLEIEIDVAAGAADINIPAMLIQPVVENAIKHGTSRVVGTGRIKIHIGLDNNALRIDVSDNGPGFPANFVVRPTEPHGLHNVAERLKGHYGPEAFLRWENGVDGTCVSIHIPAVEARRRCAS